ncbi:MAG: glycosyltransferase family 2 protein [bacterium]
MISIIIPLYNKEECIAGVIESVLKQSFVDFELLIINDGSTDNSESKVGLFTDSRIKLHNKQNGGVSSARNYGVKMAKSEWVIFLDADDVMLPNNLDILYAQQKEYNTDISTANYYVETETGSRILKRKDSCKGIVKSNLRWYYFDKYCMRMGCAMIRRSFLVKNPFPETLNRFEDLYTVLELCKQCTISFESTPILIYTAEFRDLSRLSLNYIEKDFTYHLDFSEKSIWEKLLYGQLLVFAAHNKPLDKILKQKYKCNYYYKYLALIGFKIKKIIKHSL